MRLFIIFTFNQLVYEIGKSILKSFHRWTNEKFKQSM